ncbi:hypothetical protein [Streptomyces violarus]|uniref:hypothetical protein n=1 Tax=Streptomyces violarus TaxID=67380 RepID=UPI0021C202E2|nr:hypothetical protein [Streptomyces violarus]MCT9142947.1 hypothetical protein [Streptomyces violarus]
MSKPGKSRYRLETVRRQYTDALGVPDGRVEFEFGPDDDPKVFSFPHPVFTPDDMQRELREADGDEASARILLGEHYAEFVEAGGDVSSLALLYVGLRNEAQDQVQRVRPTKG